MFDPTRQTLMETPFSCGLVWLRRDLRVSDHAALHQALKHCQRVHVVFVFDTEILDTLPRADRCDPPPCLALTAVTHHPAPR